MTNSFEPDVKYIESQKTVVMRVKDSLPYRSEVSVHLEPTRKLISDISAFYAAIFLDDLSLLSTPASKLYTVIDSLTIVTKERKEVKYPFPFDCVPALLRRACIKKAFGSVKSWHTNHKKWQAQKEKFTSRQREKAIRSEQKGKIYKQKKFSQRPPVPPRDYSNMHPVYYKGMYKDFDGNSLILKLWTGKSWAFVKQQVNLVGRSIPSGWSWGSPTLILKKDQLNLHFAIKKDVLLPNSLASQAEQSGGLTACCVDLNLDGDIAVASILHCDGKAHVTKKASLFVKGNNAISHHRKRQLGKIATAYSKTHKGFGVSKKGDCTKRFAKIKNRDRYEAHRISRRIVEFAHLHGATVIVFEWLKNLRPSKQRYSRRSNQKRAYWLKSKIIKFTKYKAFQDHSIITTFVNPKNTSRRGANCYNQQEDAENDILVSRIWAQFNTNVASLFNNVMSHTVERVDYTPGAPNYICSHTIKHRGNADFNACQNIGLKFFERYYQKPRLKVETQGLPISYNGK